jgi:anti-sigma factor RsiW
MPDIIQTMIEPNNDSEELLPSYVTGQIDLEEQALVEHHVSTCAHCRRQLAFERRMIDEFAAMTPEIDSGWARLRRRIESQQRASWWDKVARDAGAAWQTLTRPAVAALATAQLAFVGIAGALLFSLSQPSYQALGSSPPPQSANVIAMFRADTTESQLADLLRANGASLVGGPTSTDAYMLRVPA